jgi:transcription elongation factor Elf1
MGKSTSKRKPPPKKTAGKLDSQFNCPFCSSVKSCTVEMCDPCCLLVAKGTLLTSHFKVCEKRTYSSRHRRKLDSKAAQISCTVCKEKFATRIHSKSMIII